MDPQEIQVWQDAFGDHCRRVVSVSVILWDYFITLDDEWEFFWKRGPWTAVTFLFLWGRYVGILLTGFGALTVVMSKSSDPVRYSWLRIQTWFAISISWSTQAILQLRIYALYEASPRIGALLLVAFTSEVLVAIVVFSIASVKTKTVAGSVPGTNLVRCNVTATPDWLWVHWLALTAFEFLLCGLAAYKGYQRLRSIRGRNLFEILVRDSVMYYMLVQIIYASNLISWAKVPTANLDAVNGFAVAFPVVLTSRMVINIRRLLPTPEIPFAVSLLDFSLGQTSLASPPTLETPDSHG
ncbi:hypothetical protein B0H16DRAFT_1684836 [Mycena metata]|uniref:DUF6533 domain-containing protein n=1 Tax=Mycena metata TaxID=1033252 RepID=A0AAD7JXG6_9AGAR|nr:hypothetical protein B0H16DRAFT_1684836 [Mycena metata]